MACLDKDVGTGDKVLTYSRMHVTRREILVLVSNRSGEWGVGCIAAKGGRKIRLGEVHGPRVGCKSLCRCTTPRLRAIAGGDFEGERGGRGFLLSGVKGRLGSSGSG